MDKKKLTETEIRTQFITPAIKNAGWDFARQVREEYKITAGRIRVRGLLASRDKPKSADYVLFHKPEFPIAVVEAKDNKHRVGDGMQQAQGYADMMQVPFVFSSNGDSFVFHDRTGQSDPMEREISLEEFPSPEELWKKYQIWKGLDEPASEIVTQDFYSDGSGKAPRYYQLNAINRTVEAVAKGQQRNLLVMATGTGKTYTAFQIIWRLWKAKQKKRILFLADRNILVDQTKTNDFKPFGGAMTKITNRKADKSYEIYLALYQAITGNEEKKKIFKEFSPDFFDLIIIDECHRGSAAEDSAWREILEYFSTSTQIGLTATPKETKYVSNIDYFGDPVFTYSLKQGIEDGFLAPYKVVRIDIDKDLTGYRPEKGKVDAEGLEIEDRIYNQKDYDKKLVLEKRRELVADKITEFLKGTNPYDKTIVFCEDVEHAGEMRRYLVNKNPEECQKSHKYVMRITGDDQEGKAQLDHFINPEERYPVIATTSQLMSTGVDAQTCKLIVLDKSINSLTEFKQIIGRGTRVNEDYDKLFFTIMDFRNATNLFADPNFDGEPVQVYEPDVNESPIPPEDVEGDDTADGPEKDPFSDFEQSEGDFTFEGSDGEPGEKRVKYIVKDVPVFVVGERVQYYGNDGKLMTESFKDYTRKAVKKSYTSLNDFLKKWTTADQKQAIVDELEEQGVIFEALADEVGADYGVFDLICHVAFDQPPLTRKERAENVKKRNYFTKYGDEARKVLGALLDKYADEGIDDVGSMEVLKIPPINELGTPVELIKSFGGKEQYLQALKELEDELYRAA